MKKTCWVVVSKNPLSGRQFLRLCLDRDGSGVLWRPEGRLQWEDQLNREIWFRHERGWDVRDARTGEWPEWMGPRPEEARG